MDPQPSTTVIQSYVWHGAQCFFVSTIERNSSAAADPSRYNETLVWTYEWDRHIRENLIHQDADAKGSIRVHLKVCGDLFARGTVDNESDVEGGPSAAQADDILGKPHYNA